MTSVDTSYKIGKTKMNDINSVIAINYINFPCMVLVLLLLKRN